MNNPVKSWNLRPNPKKRFSEVAMSTVLGDLTNIRECEKPKRKSRTRLRKSIETDIEMDVDNDRNSIKNESRSMDVDTSMEYVISVKSLRHSSRKKQKCLVSENINDFLPNFEVPKSDDYEQRLNGIPDPPLIAWDRNNLGDPCLSTIYTQDIFTYLQEREADFKFQPYMEHQPEINAQMRTILVDWMVEVQEMFQLNHETLYLAVKCMDYYLSKRRTAKEHLQLLGGTAMFLASKMDERQPPPIEDFLFLFGETYSRKRVLLMEVSILKAVNYQLSFPISYRFLRRYGTVSGLDIKGLTLSRYILERSLHFYVFTSESDSKMAACALLLSFLMKNEGSWTNDLVIASGYNRAELLPLTRCLNNMLHESSQSCPRVMAKYSHEVFFKVATIPLIKTESIF